MKARPHVLFYTFVCLVVLVVPGIVGVIYAARQDIARSKVLALDGVCLELADGITQQLDSIFLGVKSMVSHVRQNPNCRQVVAAAAAAATVACATSAQKEVTRSGLAPNHCCWLQPRLHQTSLPLQQPASSSKDSSTPRTWSSTIVFLSWSDSQ